MSCSYIYSVCGSGAILNVPDMSTGLVVLGVQGCNEVTKYNNKRKCHSNRGLPTCLRARCPAIYLCNPTLPLRSASNRGRSHPVQHRTDLMTTSDHLLAAVPEFSSIRPTRLDLDALHQQQHTHKVPPEDHLLPRASPAAVTKRVGTKVRIDGCCVAPLSQLRHWKFRTGRHLTYTYPFTGQCGSTSLPAPVHTDVPVQGFGHGVSCV